MNVAEIYHGSNGAATTRLMRALEARGRLGLIAAALFRAMKASARAKKYHGGIERGYGDKAHFVSYRSLAHDLIAASRSRLDGGRIGHWHCGDVPHILRTGLWC